MPTFRVLLLAAQSVITDGIAMSHLGNFCRRCGWTHWYYPTLSASPPPMPSVDAFAVNGASYPLDRQAALGTFSSVCASLPSPTLYEHSKPPRLHANRTSFRLQDKYPAPRPLRGETSAHLRALLSVPDRVLLPLIIQYFYPLECCRHRDSFITEARNWVPNMRNHYVPSA